MGAALSIVVPAFDEEARIGASLAAIGDYLAARGEAAEVVVVDDGSRDGTREVVERFAAASRNLPVRLLSNPTNSGKGFSVRRGLLAAEGELVLFTDADLSAPIAEADPLLERLRQGLCDIAVGSRGLDATYIQRHQALPRELLGRSFNLAIRAATGLAVTDTQCGFKAMDRRRLRPLVEAAQVTRFAFDVELLVLCQAAGLRISEIPVRWSHKDGSKVRVLHHGVEMLADTARVMRRLRRGDYAAALAEARRS